MGSMRVSSESTVSFAIFSVMRRQPVVDDWEGIRRASVRITSARNLNHRISRRMVRPAAQRIALIASPFGPARWFRSSWRLFFIWPIRARSCFGVASRGGSLER